MKFAKSSPVADPEIASTIEPVQNSRIFVELLNAPFLRAGGSPGEHRAGLDRALDKGWLTRHEGGTYVRFAGPLRGRESMAKNVILLGEAARAWCDDDRNPLRTEG